MNRHAIIALVDLLFGIAVLAVTTLPYIFLDGSRWVMLLGAVVGIGWIAWVGYRTLDAYLDDNDYLDVGDEGEP